jgi:cytochrome c2
MRRLIPLCAALALTACHDENRHDDAKALIAAKCGACLVVPGGRTAIGRVGPSLTGFARRQVIAGRFTNNRQMLIRWLLHPQMLQPGGAMPDTGLTPPQAARIADYLQTLDKR